MISGVEKTEQYSEFGMQNVPSPLTGDSFYKRRGSALSHNTHVSQMIKPEYMTSGAVQEFCGVLQNYSLIERMQILTELLRDSNRKY